VRAWRTHHVATLLQDGTSKMSKSAENDASRINLTDTPDIIAQKVWRGLGGVGLCVLLRLTLGGCVPVCMVEPIRCKLLTHGPAAVGSLMLRPDTS
jgi:hypothetical protein